MTFIAEVRETKENLRYVFPETPLKYSDYLSQKYEADIYLKREDLTPVRSYKIRGAFSFLSSVMEGNQNDRSQKFVCASAGNHAQGFAFACQHFGVHGTVFMPVTTPPQKIGKTKAFGGEFITVKLIGDIFDQANKAALDFCDKEKAMMVPPFDHPLIIQGQATVGLEILDQLEGLSPDMIMVPVGGGGLSAGISEVFKTESPDTQIFCCEPEEAPSLKQSLASQSRETLTEISTFVDGAAVATIGSHNFAHLKRNIITPVQLVPENRLCSTLLECLNQIGMVLEPAGALSIDALKNFESSDLKGKTIVCVTSGSNFDFERLPEVKERSMKYEGCKKYFILRLPQRPGALKEFLTGLGPEDDIARFEYLKKSSKTFGSILVGIETTQAQNFDELISQMKKQGFDLKDVTNDEFLSDFLI